MTEKDRHTYRQADKSLIHKGRHTDRQADKSLTEKDTPTDCKSLTEKDIHTYRQADKTLTEKDIHTYRRADKILTEKDRHTYRQADKTMTEKDRHTHTQADKERQTHPQRGRQTLKQRNPLSAAQKRSELNRSITQTTPQLVRAGSVPAPTAGNLSAKLYFATSPWLM